VMSLATRWDWVLRLSWSDGSLVRRKIVSSLERFAFWSRISSVMNGLWVRWLTETVFSGACLSRTVVKVVLNWSRYELRVLAGDEYKEDTLMSLEKAAVSMER
jgi:hypothetical protein